MARLKARPQSHRLQYPLNARQVETLDAMLQELFKAVRQPLPASSGADAVESVEDDGDGVVTVNNADPLNPIVGFGGVNVDATLSGDGTSGSPLTVVSASPWTTVFKTANQSKTSNNTPAADSLLTVALTANKKYVLLVRVFYTGHTTPDFQHLTSFSGTTTRVSQRRRSLLPNSTTQTDAMFEAFDTATTRACATGHDGYLEEDISLDVGASGGTFSFDWAQNTSDVNATTVYAGSFIKYRQLD